MTAEASSVDRCALTPAARVGVRTGAFPTAPGEGGTLHGAGRGDDIHRAGRGAFESPDGETKQTYDKRIFCALPDFCDQNCGKNCGGDR